jgi:hypothetical protein
MRHYTSSIVRKACLVRKRRTFALRRELHVSNARRAMSQAMESGARVAGTMEQRVK